MSARPHSTIAEFPQSRTSTTCAACAAYDLSLCRTLSEAPLALQYSEYTVPARRILCRQHELLDVVPVICRGWAASIVMLSDGSRQILSFLLPGDAVSTALLFDARPYFMVEAITDVHYRGFKRSDVRTVLARQPDLLDSFCRTWAQATARADQLIVDLGRRTADERIARLLLYLAERLAQRGMTQRGTMEMEFPLRQHHIADATGLTPVHVSKVLSEFRRSGLIKISERSLTILDPERFQRIGHMR